MAANRRARHSVPSPRGDPPCATHPRAERDRTTGALSARQARAVSRFGSLPHGYESVKARRGTLPIPGPRAPESHPTAPHCAGHTDPGPGGLTGRLALSPHRPSFLEHATSKLSEWTALCLPPPSQQAPGSPLHSNTHSRWLHSGTAPSPSQVSGPRSPATSLWARSQEAKPTGQRLRSVSSTGQSCCPDGPSPGSLPCTAASSPGLPNGRQASVLCPLAGSHRCSVFILDQTMSPLPACPKICSDPKPRYLGLAEVKEEILLE